MVVGGPAGGAVVVDAGLGGEEEDHQSGRQSQHRGGSVAPSQSTPRLCTCAARYTPHSVVQYGGIQQSVKKDSIYDIIW